MKQPAVHILANRRNGTLYTGVTSNLPQRVWQHRQRTGTGFTARYGCKLLVWFEMHDNMVAAITREKQIKGGSRAKKISLITSANPDWREACSDTIEMDCFVALRAPRNDEASACFQRARYRFASTLPSSTAG